MNPLWTLYLFFFVVSALPVRDDEGTEACGITWVTVRTDGRCGKDWGGASCDPNGNYGGCCSAWGHCGSTPTHCLVSSGCQNGCNEGGANPANSSSSETSNTAPSTDSPAPGFHTITASVTSPRSDGRCGKEFGGATCDPNGNYGGCCSAWGHCGSTPTHCLVSNDCQNGCTDDDANTAISPSSENSNAPTSTDPSATSFRSDGRCGKEFGGATCDPNGNYGGCCSGPWGQCGSTPTHCLVAEGCQNGCTD